MSDIKKFKYYVVYSCQTYNGSLMGRNTITAAHPINTMNRIEQVEGVLLEQLQKTNRDYTNLFLISWTQIHFDEGDNDE